MLTCPMCKKPLRQLTRECPTCRADLSLLIDFIGNLSDGLSRAEQLTREGELGKAVWAYLEVLEVDPENEIARNQVGEVVTAVRHFDRVASRRWMKRLRRQERFRRALNSQEDGEIRGWTNIIWAVLVVAAFAVGWFLSAGA